MITFLYSESVGSYQDNFKRWESEWQKELNIMSFEEWLKKTHHTRGNMIATLRYLRRYFVEEGFDLFCIGNSQSSPTWLQVILPNFSLISCSINYKPLLLKQMKIQANINKKLVQLFSFQSTEQFCHLVERSCRSDLEQFTLLFYFYLLLYAQESIIDR